MRTFCWNRLDTSHGAHCKDRQFDHLGVLQSDRVHIYTVHCTIEFMDAMSLIVGIVIGSAIGAAVAVMVRRGGGEAGILRQERDTLRSERDAERQAKGAAEPE